MFTTTKHHEVKKRGINCKKTKNDLVTEIRLKMRENENNVKEIKETLRGSFTEHKCRSVGIHDAFYFSFNHMRCLRTCPKLPV